MFLFVFLQKYLQWLHMIKNYYQGIQVFPAHLSAGAVLITDRNEVCSLHFDTISVPQFSHLRDFSILMRETMEMWETLEEAVLRGIREEFWAEGIILAYLGSHVSSFLENDMKVEKTTLFFLVRCTSIDTEKRELEDAEKEGIVTWLPIQDLKKKIQAQYERFHEEDINEAEILTRAEEYLGSIG